MAKRSIQNESCSASVMDLGATILSWHPVDGHELLFVSSASTPQSAEFHGGIPLCAPWFARGQGDWHVPHNHGLIRYVDWEFLGAKQERTSTRLEWKLEQSAVAHLPGAERYPKDLRYHFVATFGARLDIDLTIESPTEPVSVDTAFHSYFLVNNVEQAEIVGITKEPLVVAGHHDLIYPDTASNVVEIRMPDRVISIEGRGMKDVVVWNPGAETAGDFDGLDASEWPRMLCVELGNVQSNAVELPAGGSLSMGMTIQMRSRSHT